MEEKTYPIIIDSEAIAEATAQLIEHALHLSNSVASAHLLLSESARIISMRGQEIAREMKEHAEEVRKNAH